MVKRLVFLDVDGTLIGHDQHMPDSTRKAIEGALANGHELFMCTGRSKPEIYPHLWDMGFRGLVGCNGAYGEVDGVTLFNDQMQSEDVAEIAKWLADHGVEHTWLTGTEIYPTKNVFERFNAMDHEGVEGAEWSHYVKMVEPFSREGVPETAAKVVIMLDRDSRVSYQEVIEKFGERFCVIGGSLPTDEEQTLELTDYGMNKSVGLRRVAEHLGVPLEQTVAIGDSSNDLEMLAVAGVGVAMGNGTDQAKAVADWVTEDINQDGLALAFQRLGLID